MTEGLTVWALLLIKKKERIFFLKKYTKYDAVLVHLSYLKSQKDTNPHCPLPPSASILEMLKYRGQNIQVVIFPEQTVSIGT